MADKSYLVVYKDDLSTKEQRDNANKILIERGWMMRTPFEVEHSGKAIEGNLLVSQNAFWIIDTNGISWDLPTRPIGFEVIELFTASSNEDIIVVLLGKHTGFDERRIFNYSDFEIIKEKFDNQIELFIYPTKTEHKRVKVENHFIKFYGFEGAASYTKFADILISKVLPFIGDKILLVDGKTHGNPINLDSLKSYTISNLPQASKNEYNKKYGRFPSASDVFVFSLWAYIQGGSYLQQSPSAPSKMFGVDTRCVDTKPVSDIGFFITDKESGFVAAHTNLLDYLIICLDCFHNADDSNNCVSKQFEAICDGFAVWLKTSKEERETIVAKLNNERLLKFFNEFATMRYNSAKSEYKEAIETLEDISKRLIEISRDAVFKEKELQFLEKDKGDIREIARKELDKVLKNKKIISVKPDTQGVSLETAPIYCIDERTKKMHLIGEFTINLNFKSGRVFFFNKTLKRKAFHDTSNAPHVFSDGKPCLGTLEAYLPKMIARWELFNVAHLCINFLEQANTADTAGWHVHKWPEVDRTTKEIIYDYLKDDKAPFWFKCGGSDYCSKCKYHKVCKVRITAISYTGNPANLVNEDADTSVELDMSDDDDDEDEDEDNG
jgi:hypothetical protein